MEGLAEKDIYNAPWIKHSFTGIHYYTSHKFAKHGDPLIFEGRYSYEYLDDNPRMSFRKGDIVRFSNGFIKCTFSDWRRWFVEAKDKKRFYLKDPKVPVYARNQLAIVIGRYRKVKFKYARFADYGVIIMMLTGSKIGHIRHYWGTGCNRPFRIISRFPHLPKILIKRVPEEVKKIYIESYEDSNDSRNNLVSKIYGILQKGS